MHLTKAETVNFYCGLSLNAFCLELVILQLYLYVVIVSDVNISVSFALIGIVVQIIKRHQILKPQCRGDITYSVNGQSVKGRSVNGLSVKGEWQEQHSLADVLSVNTVCGYWFLIIHLSDKQVKLLWRDSCSEWVYRYLIVQDKQRRYTSALEK